MQSLLDPHGNYLKSEKNVKKYLRSITDKEIKVFYENVELTPFPIILAKEYHKRFTMNKLRTKNIKNKSKNLKSFSGNKIKRVKGKKFRPIPFRHGRGIEISTLKKR